MTEHAPDRLWSGIDIPKTIAGTLAAVSAAVVGSFLGVAGTLIGAAVASLIGSVGTELYARFINRGSKKIVSTFVTAPAAVGTPTVVAAEDELPSEEPVVEQKPARKDVRWGRIAVMAGALFVLAMGSLTAFELLTGKSVPAAVGHTTSSTTTIGSALSGDNGTDEKPATTPSESPSPDSSGAPADGQPTGTPTAEPTETPATPPTATTEPANPQQTGGTDPGAEPTDQPTDGETQPDGTTQDGTTQDGAKQDGTTQDGTNQQSGE
uniref:hypothetical protein n=1 Tax=Paractinoplanes polyasparticus TaxID=2856853 RepID=UPI001C85990F|nr:hypothetical protein [Actinoplanes polyasparticus]